MTVERERRDPGIEILRLNRPERRNALDTPTLAALLAALDGLAEDDGLRALVLSSTSTRAFCAGADVAERLAPQAGVARMERFAALYAALADFPVPTVCVCVGDVLGAGAELAAGADLRVGGDNLRLGWVGARLGVPVGPARLVPLIGLARAKDLLLTGRILDAGGAEAVGLLHRTAPADEAERVALELAVAIAAHPPAGVRQMKALLRELDDTGARVAHENAALLAWQRDGAGLPQG